MKIKVDEKFTYIGRFDFEIAALSDEWPKSVRGSAIAQGERFIFAQADTEQKIEKLFIVQFEGFRPDNDFTYNYNFQNAERIGNNQYRHNTWFYNTGENARQNPQNGGAKTMQFLRERGFQVEDELMMSRFVGLASPDRRHEIILYHLEMLQPTTGYTLADWQSLVLAEVARRIEAAFLARSRKSFVIIEG